MNSRKRNASILMVSALTLFCFRGAAFSGTMHTVSGTVTYPEGGSPSSAAFSAYITTRTGETLTQSSAGCGYSGGYYWVQCGNFPSSWSAGDVLHVDINNGAGRTASGDVTLTNNANDPGNLVMSPLPPRSITVSTDPSGLTVTIDGTPYSGTQVFTWDVGSSHTLSVASAVSGGSGIQYAFASWSDAGARSHTYTVPNSDQTVSAGFNTQYYLTVSSTAGSPAGEGWYNSGSSATFGVTSPSSGGAGTQYVLNGWSGSGSGSYTGANASSSVTMNNPITETAAWNTQYRLTVASAYGSASGTGWYDAGASANFSLSQTTVSGGSGTQYLFLSWTGSGGGSYTGSNASSSVTMNNPVTETAGWQTQYYLTTAENPGAGGDMTPAPPGGWYDSGTAVGVNAIEAGGYGWGGWSGDLTGGTRPHSVNMTGPKSVTANFGLLVTYTFNTDPAGRAYKVDGSTYTGSQSFTWLAGSLHTLGGQTTQSGGTGIQYVLYSIGDNYGHEFLPGGSLPSETSLPFYAGAADLTITGRFKTQYYLTVVSTAGSPTGQGWYNSGSSAAFGVTSPWAGGAGTRYVFTGWAGSGSGSYTGSNAASSVTMNNPVTETAGWKIQYQLTVASARGTPSGANWYDAGANADFTVTPATVSGGAGTQYVFTGWTGSGGGSYTGPGISSTVTMNNPIAETAGWKTQYYLTTADNPDAGGDMSPAPPGGWYDSGAVVNVDAAVAGGYAWAGWSGHLSGTTKPATITMTGAKSVTANFANIQVTITTNPAGRAILVDGANFTSPQTFTWTAGSAHTLSAPSPQGLGAGIQYLFTSWSQGGGQTQSYTVPGSNATVTAGFKIQYLLNVSSSRGNPQGSGWYDSGATAHYSVTSPDVEGTARYLLSDWAGDASGAAASGAMLMNGPKTATANWSLQYFLTVLSEHGNPQGSGWINAGATAGFSVTSPDAQGSTRYTCTGWTGDFTGSGPSGSVSMTAAKTVTADWSTQYFLSASENPGEGGDMTPAPPGAWFDSGSEAACIAVPAADFTFGGWSGDLSGAEATMHVVMDGPKSVIANFAIKGKVRIASNPAGLALMVDGVPYAMPHDFSWEHGSTHAISAADTLQNGAAGIRYRYLNWSDGGSRTHDIIIDGIGVYTANFRTQYLLTTAAVPPAGGSVRSAPEGPWHDAESTAILTSDPNGEAGYLFEGWSGDATGNVNPVPVILNGPKNITALFRQQVFVLTTAAEPASDGVIHRFPDRSEYVYGERVKLTVEVFAGHYCRGWDEDGEDRGMADTLEVVMDRDKSIRARLGVTAVEEPGDAKGPAGYQLMQNYPNPFNPETTICYRMARAGMVTIEIYDNLGRKVRTLVREVKREGLQEAVWDGRNDDGRTVESGLYVYSMRSGNYAKIMKAAFIK